MIQSVSGMGGGMMRMQGAQGGQGPQAAFNKIDADGDGAVSSAELQTLSDMMAEKMGDKAPSADDLMAKFDGDGDGAMSFAEFESARPQGPPDGGMSAGMIPPGKGYGKANQMDLSSLFAESEDEAESEEESLYAYA